MGEFFLPIAIAIAISIAFGYQRSNRTPYLAPFPAGPSVPARPKRLSMSLAEQSHQ